MPARAYRRRFACFLSASVPPNANAPPSVGRRRSEDALSCIPNETRHAARSNSGLVKPGGSPLRPDLASSHTFARTSAARVARGSGARGGARTWGAARVVRSHASRVERRRLGDSRETENEENEKDEDVEKQTRLVRSGRPRARGRASEGRVSGARGAGRARTRLLTVRQASAREERNRLLSAHGDRRGRGRDPSVAYALRRFAPVRVHEPRSQARGVPLAPRATRSIAVLASARRFRQHDMAGVSVHRAVHRVHGDARRETGRARVLRRTRQERLDFRA